MAQPGIVYNVQMSGIQAAAAQVQAFGARLQRIMRPLTLPVGGVLSGLRGIESGVGRALGAVTGLHGKLLALTGGIGLGYVAKQSMEAAASMESLNAQFFTLLKDRTKARAMMDDLMGFADVTPFTPQVVAGAGSQLLGAGYQPDQIKDLLRDVGDLAAGAQKPLDQAANIFGRLNAGSFGEAFEALRSQFLISKTDLEAEGLTFDKGGSYVGSAQDAIEAVRKAIRSKFGGAMEEQAKTWNGKMSTLQGYVQKLWAKLGEPIQDALKPWLDRAIETVKNLSDRAQDLGRNLARGIQTGLNLIEGGKAGEALELSFTVASRRAGAALQAAIQAALQGVFSKDFVTAATSAFQSIGYNLSAILLDAFAEPIAYFQAGIQTALDMVANPKAALLMAEKALRTRNLHVEERTAAEGGLFSGAAERKLPGLREDLARVTAELDAIEKPSFQANLEAARSRGPRIMTASGEMGAADLRAESDKSAAAAEKAFAKVGSGFLSNFKSAFADKIANDPELASAQAKLDELIASFQPGAQEGIAAEGEGGSGGALGGGAPTSALEAAMRPQADRLAQIGGFVGGSSRDMEDAAKRTATFTERTAKAVEKIQTAPKVSAEGIKF